MILDLQQQLSAAQAFTASGLSTNVIDFGSDRNVGIGEPLAIIVGINTGADITTGDETYQFDVKTGSAATVTTLVYSRIVAAASLTAGKQIVLPLPADTVMDRYLGLYLTLGGTTPSITITAFLVPQSMVQKDAVYASAISIL